MRPGLDLRMAARQVVLDLRVARLRAIADNVNRRVVFPSILPGILSGVAMAFAKAVGEFGSLVIITGNLPYKTEVASVYIFGRIESGRTESAAAVSVVLLVLSFALLLAIGAIRHHATRHDRE